LVGLPLAGEVLGVFFVGQAPGHHGHAVLEVGQSRDFHAQTEAVQQLGPEFPLFRIHGAHQDEAGRVLEGNALPLHHIHAHGCSVQQHVHQVVVQEIHFIHVKDAPVGRGQKPRLEVFLPGLDGLFQVNGAEQAVLSGAQGQVHHRHGPVAHRQLLAWGQTGPAGVAHKLRLLRVAVKSTVGHHGNGGQKRSQTPGRGGFGRALLAPHQNSSQAGVNGIKNESLFQQFLAHQGRKGIHGSVRGHNGSIIP
jgi:hypothetical protein